MDNRFERTSFQSADFQAETSETPKIKAGGSSSSDVLNRYFSALSQDISLQSTRLNILARRADRIALGATEQAGSLLSALQSLSSRVDTASGYGEVLADMHSSFYVDTGATTATVNQRFGQATLPIVSETDLLVTEDAYGNKYVSPELEFSWATSDITSIQSLPFSEYRYDPDGVAMIKNDQLWIMDNPHSHNIGYVRIKVPLHYRGLSPNVLEIWPFPAFDLSIRAMWYRKIGDPYGTWTQIDQRYLPGYNGSVLAKAGPIRAFLPANVEGVSEIGITFTIGSSNVWGIKQINLKHVEFESSAVLVVQDPYGRNISSALLRGKDAATTLSGLSVTNSSNQVQINLTTTNTITSPVITGVIMRV